MPGRCWEAQLGAQLPLGEPTWATEAQLWVDSTSWGSVSNRGCRHRYCVMTSLILAQHQRRIHGVKTETDNVVGSNRESTALEGLEGSREPDHQPVPSWHLGSGPSLSQHDSQGFPEATRGEIISSCPPQKHLSRLKCVLERSSEKSLVLLSPQPALSASVS